jgi:hypothetical protein
MPVAFFTIGHSTRSIEEFVGLLQSAGVVSLLTFGPFRTHGEIPSSIARYFRQS